MYQNKPNARSDGCDHQPPSHCATNISVTGNCCAHPKFESADYHCRNDDATRNVEH